MATVVSSGGGGSMVKHVIQTPHHITIEEDEVPVPILISMVISVADPRDVYPWFLIFIHLGSRVQQEQQKKSRGEKLVLLTYFCSHKCYKTENYLI
jgi:hypothetical protein